MTMKVKEAAKYIDVKVLDHLIVTPSGYFHLRIMVDVRLIPSDNEGLALWLKGFGAR